MGNQEDNSYDPGPLQPGTTTGIGWEFETAPDI